MGAEEYGAALKAELERVQKERDNLENTRQALIQEFAVCNSVEETVAKAREAIKTLLPKAIIQAGILLDTAESESVRASLSKFIINTALDESKMDSDNGNVLKSLLNQLAKNDALPEGITK